MDAWTLPDSIDVNGVEYAIRTDFRDVLHVLKYFDDPSYTNSEKWEVCIRVLVKEWKKIDKDNVVEAVNKLKEFIDCGNEDSNSGPKMKVMDWSQDARYIIPSINKVLGCEVRSLPYMHWWTFMGAYMEIGEGVYSNIVNIRVKKAKGKKLEKWENDFYRDNRSAVDLKHKYTLEELKEQEELKKMLD